MAVAWAFKVQKDAEVPSDSKYHGWRTRGHDMPHRTDRPLLPLRVSKLHRRVHMNRKQGVATTSVVLFVLMAAWEVVAQAGWDEPGEWQAVEQAIGRSGQVQADGAYKLGFPRSDLKVTVEGVELKPALALGGWVAFSKPGTDSMIMGDLVLVEDEVIPVMSSLENSGVQETALHNPLLHVSPPLIHTTIR